MPLRETVSDVLLETLQAHGVRYLFANMGTDYPPIVESLAKYDALGAPLPQVVICPHETTAITAAHGAYLASGQGQAVLVHVGVGTQNLGGSLHQAWTGRVPMLIFAGRSPVTTRGEMLGSRDNFIHFYQDVRDQGGVIRQFTKWEFNLELPEQIAYALQRGLRVMESDPPGAIYVTAAREVLGMPAPQAASDSAQRYARPELGRLAPADALRLAQALQQAERPLIVTSYLGRRPEAVELLVGLSEALHVPVVEPVPTFLNFPRRHPHHWGFRALPAVQHADLVLLIDTDVPWVPKFGGPQPGTPVVQLDVDPVKAHITLWDFPVTESHQVRSHQALADLVACARGLPALNGARLAARKQWLAAHQPAWPGTDARRPASGRPTGPEGPLTESNLTAATTSALLGEELGPDTVIVDEGVSNADAIRMGTRRTRPGTYFGQSGGSLGWGGGAALGFKLMSPASEVVSIVGDGSYIFSVPSSLFMTAQRYGAPFLTVIYNNSGWNAVKMATDRMYGADSHAARSGAYQHRLGTQGQLEQVAAAFGCYAAAVQDAAGLRTALGEARAQVAQGRCAVINAILTQE